MFDPFVRLAAANEQAHDGQDRREQHDGGNQGEAEATVAKHIDTVEAGLSRD